MHNEFPVLLTIRALFLEISQQDDVSKLQADLEIIYEWSRTSNTALNPNKFECSRYGLNISIKELYLYNTGATIESCHSGLDIGVTMTPDACFNEHISNISNCASLKCGWISRTIKTNEC